MLKFLYASEVFQEIPDEISLAIAITGCKIHCKGCHSKELWEDRGGAITPFVLGKLLQVHKGVTCVCFMGGEHDIQYLQGLIEEVHYNYGLKTAWYCGLDEIPKEHIDIIDHLDFLKLGHYDENLGGLDSPTTNQRLYQIEHLGEYEYKEIDITYKLQKQNENQSI